MQFVTTRFVNDFMQLRESLEAAKSSAGSAESSFKGIEGKSADMRRTASNIDTYAARNDNDSKDCSDEGKAALSKLNGIARDQKTLEELHRTEEGARVTSSNELTEASGLARGLNIAPNDKSTLLNAIGNAQQQNSQGSYEYTNVDTTIFTASLDLPEAIDRATSISEDSDGQDKSLQGTFLDQRLDKLENTYGQASSFADRAESYQDRVGGEVERALIELSRIEQRRSREMVMNATPLLAGEQLQTFVHLGQVGSYKTLGFADIGAPVVSMIATNDNAYYATFNYVFEPQR